MLKQSTRIVKLKKTASAGDWARIFVRAMTIAAALAVVTCGGQVADDDPLGALPPLPRAPEPASTFGSRSTATPESWNLRGPVWLA